MHFSVSKRLKSFVYAFRGAVALIATQHNAWIHLAATAAVVLAGILFRISSGEWAAICISIGMVWCAEAMNTAIELLGDEISLNHRERIGHAKDIAAFAVLAAAVSSAVVGTIIFGRHIFGQK